jgi:hypothetical protein
MTSIVFTCLFWYFGQVCLELFSFCRIHTYIQRQRSTEVCSVLIFSLIYQLLTWNTWFFLVPC